MKEDVVIEALGDPRLIAKTIVQTYNMNDNPIKNQYQGYQEFREEDQADVPEHVFARKARRFITIGIIVLVLLAVVSIIFSIVRFLLPITITFIMIWFLFSIIMRLFQGK